MSSKEWTVSASEAAERLGLGSSWGIYEGVRRGEIPNVGVGTRVRIPVRWINERLGIPDSPGITNPSELQIPLSLEVLERLTEITEHTADLTGTPLDRQIAAGLRLHHAQATAALAASEATDVRPLAASAGAASGTVEHDSTARGVQAVTGQPASAHRRRRVAAVPTST